MMEGICLGHNNKSNAFPRVWPVSEASAATTETLYFLSTHIWKASEQGNAIFSCSVNQYLPISKYRWFSLALEPKFRP